MASIANAEVSVDMRTYIFDNDDYAIAIADTLKERSEDVRIRVMLDGIGTMLAMQSDPDTLPADHRSPLSIRMYLERDSEVKVRNTTNPYFTGDHTKTTIIDKKIAFVGGMNIGREYRYDWHDMMMEVSGPVVDTLQHESDKAWARGSIFGDFANFVQFVKGKKEHADKDGYPVRILQTRNFDSDIHKAQIAAIQSAQSYIIIENAYFSDDRTIYELAKARRRGVAVHVIIPSQGNHGALNASNKVTVNKLLQHGIRVHEFLVRILQTRNFDSDIHKAQIAAIQSAQSYIIIENAYFSDDRTIYELAKARRRGVAVHVIIPSQGNHGALNASNKVTVNKLLQHGIRVHEFPGMSHIKAAIYDGWASVGSANFDKFSLKVNKELNLAVSDPETINALLDQVFIPDIMASREISQPFETTFPGIRVHSQQAASAWYPCTRIPGNVAHQSGNLRRLGKRRFGELRQV